MVISEISVNPMRNHDQKFKGGRESSMAFDRFTIFATAVVGKVVPVKPIFVTMFDLKSQAAKNREFC